MTTQPFRRNRDVVPRWRPLSRVLASGELSIPSPRPGNFSIPDELQRRLAAWRNNNDVVAAAELVETAIVEGMESEAERAARSLTRTDSGATPLVQKQADKLLQRLGLRQADIQIAVDIRALRHHVHQFQHDALSWADLALGYVTIGKREAACKAMAVALQLAPTDRHILRSAARMYLHFNDPEQAHDLLKKSPATKTDPWLAAGEIALASTAKRNPSFFKIGNEMLADGDFHPFHISELASAIGTVHLRDGNRKARKLFRRSLISPTGNSLAQAEWANPFLGGEIVTSRQIADVPDSGEARAFQAYWASNFEELLTICENWTAEEPFSSKPHAMGSFAAITNDNMDLAIKFSKDGLALQPDSALLQNHLAYALIASAEYAEASQILRQALSKNHDEMLGGYFLATAGMLAIRLGSLDDGIKKYRSSMAEFKRRGNRSSEALAAAFLSLEVARTEDPMASDYIKEAEDLSKDFKYNPEIKVVLDRAKKWESVVRQRKQLP